ncbi:hypothetical protein RF11_04671 [Thelohanellus kitauei]|uniref:Uncharacterized protein n=1 Tax=Thelohanellus kitauei TaxID=669202 RepID=A0A0C2ND70_THEKT|nr:hypothetical protein RF11_04671 [Thelohanellus kitauei]
MLNMPHQPLSHKVRKVFKYLEKIHLSATQNSISAEPAPKQYIRKQDGNDFYALHKYTLRLEKTEIQSVVLQECCKQNSLLIYLYLVKNSLQLKLLQQKSKFSILE